MAKHERRASIPRSSGPFAGRSVNPAPGPVKALEPPQEDASPPPGPIPGDKAEQVVIRLYPPQIRKLDRLRSVAIPGMTLNRSAYFRWLIDRTSG